MNSVLVVEDDLVLQRAFHDVIASLGSRVWVAPGVRAAKRAVRRLQPGVGLVDNYLKDGNGIELISWWRAEDPDARLVLMSGLGGNELGFAAARAGADLAIDKPARVAEIASCMSAIDARPPGDIASDELASYEHLLKVLARCNGNKSAAAKYLQRSRGWIARKLAAGRPRR